MKDLSRFFVVPFDRPGIGLGRLLAFTTDHLQRMIANNPGQALDGRIAATRSALAEVDTHAVDDMGMLGERKGSKKVKRRFRTGLRARIAKIAGAVIARYGPKSSQYTLCFARGRRIFNICSDDSLGGHLATLHTGIASHEADLGAAVVAEAAALIADWKVVYVASESASGGKTATQEAKRLAREHLQLTLYLNLVKLMELFPRQPEKCAHYMQQSLLRPRASGVAEPA